MSLTGDRTPYALRVWRQPKGWRAVESGAGAVAARSGAVHAQGCRRCGPETVGPVGGKVTLPPPGQNPTCTINASGSPEQIGRVAHWLVTPMPVSLGVVGARTTVAGSAFPSRSAASLSGFDGGAPTTIPSGLAISRHSVTACTCAAQNTGSSR